MEVCKFSLWIAKNELHANAEGKQNKTLNILANILDTELKFERKVKVDINHIPITTFQKNVSESSIKIFWNCILERSLVLTNSGLLKV